jgi:hypothetical protein
MEPRWHLADVESLARGRAVLRVTEYAVDIGWPKPPVRFEDLDRVIDVARGEGGQRGEWGGHVRPGVSNDLARAAGPYAPAVRQTE